MEKQKCDLQYWVSGKFKETILTNANRSMCVWKKNELTRLGKHKSGLLMIVKTK